MMTDDAYRVHKSLREIKNLKCLLEANELEQGYWRTKAESTGSVSDVKVQSSPASDAMERAVLRLIELEAEHEQLLTELFDSIGGALMMLDGLSVDEVSILRLYYFCNSTDEEISGYIHLSRQRVNQLRHQALDKIGRAMKD